MIDWDWVLAASIIIALILTIWAKISHQTIPELLAAIKDVIEDRREESVEYASEVVIHD